MYITALDPTRASISDTVMITVFSENDPPVLTSLEPIIIDEDQTYLLPSIAKSL